MEHKVNDYTVIIDRGPCNGWFYQITDVEPCVKDHGITLTEQEYADYCEVMHRFDKWQTKLRDLSSLSRL